MTNMRVDDVLDALASAELMCENWGARLDALLNALNADLGKRDDMLTWLYIQHFLMQENGSPEVIREMLVAALCRLVRNQGEPPLPPISKSRKGRRS